MVGLRYIATVSVGDDRYSSGITDLSVVATTTGAKLYSTNRPGEINGEVRGGLAAYDVTGPGAALRMSQRDFDGNIGRLGTPKIAVVSYDQGSFILPTGVTAGYQSAWALNGDGNLTSEMNLSDNSLSLSNLLALTQLVTGSVGYVVASLSGTGGIGVYSLDGQGGMSLEGRADTSGPDITDMAQITLGGAAFVIGVSPIDDVIVSYRVDAGGQPRAVDRLDSLESGVGFSTAHLVATATVEGTGYAIVGGAGSSSLTVLRVTPQGQLIPVEHLVDGLDTRFQNVTALETFTIGDRSFVLVGGADDGVTLMALLGDGRLIHLDTLADTQPTTLQNVTAIAAVQTGASAQVFVTSESETGITQFSFDLGQTGVMQTGGAGSITGTAGADVLTAGSGTTDLTGGAGDDILRASAEGGDLRMLGGLGADIFVAEHNGHTLYIDDFQLGYDRIDLSLFPMLRSTQQLEITRTGQGAIISFRDTDIVVRSSIGQAIAPESFLHEDMLALTRYDPPQNPQNFTGTARSEQLALGGPGGMALGMEGNDTITSSWGDATIGGGAGDDLIVAGSGRNLIYGGAGSDTVQGGSGADEIWGGGVGNNRLLGNEGNDTITGGDGADLLGGGEGDDALFGGAGNDEIYLGVGNDFSGGGAGNDLIIGGAGTNLIYTGLGRDEVQGGWGRDIIVGGGGPNRLFGNDGNDWMRAGDAGDLLAGGAGDDELYGGAGDDAIYLGLGNDFVGGGAGNDLIIGVAGTNLIYTGLGRDEVQGGWGRDIIVGGGGPNRLFGNDGNDWMRAGDAGDLLAGGAGDDEMYGGAGDDAIYLGLGNDFVGAGAGNDLITAGAGRNTIYASIGNDTIHSGTGRDFISGGAGADVFVFASAAHAGNGAQRDLIADFVPGQDMIDLTAMGMSFGFSLGRAGVTTIDGFVLGDVNGDGIHDFSIQVWQAGLLGVEDFIL
ncbi:Bifunctional hemolysin/adenylate cyclase precursor [Roseovarius gaetbuli]|uniref:Bifunctional hemolysin/adenylate cyclase n=1 Tax=Roseovarius gaetbuli TaxID=1356575 RepID=A0A1X7A4R0_9RHOB|nr:hypothetical protein [Roseovarius gaetbuli]SLN70230.1 Bifunctional hemolysin/adenylate cyclase precursor [Roseovarius gaetbuli]